MINIVDGELVSIGDAGSNAAGKLSAIQKNQKTVINELRKLAQETKIENPGASKEMNKILSELGKIGTAFMTAKQKLKTAGL